MGRITKYRGSQPDTKNQTHFCDVPWDHVRAINSEEGGYPNFKSCSLRAKDKNFSIDLARWRGNLNMEIWHGKLKHCIVCGKSIKEVLSMYTTFGPSIGRMDK